MLEQNDELATLRARVAELESLLAKATRPAPAVGQVWRHPNGVEYAILRWCSGNMYHRCFFDDGTIGGGIPNLADVVCDSDTYIGKFAGFKIEEVSNG